MRALLAAIMLAPILAACLDINVAAPEPTRTATPTPTIGGRILAMPDDEVDTILREAGWPESVIASGRVHRQALREGATPTPLADVCPTSVEAAYLEELAVVSAKGQKAGLTLTRVQTESDIIAASIELETLVFEMEALDAPESLAHMHEL